MKPRQWKIRRARVEMKNAAQRWDHAYQNLLSQTEQAGARSGRDADVTARAPQTTTNHKG